MLRYSSSGSHGFLCPPLHQYLPWSLRVHGCNLISESFICHSGPGKEHSLLSECMHMCDIPINLYHLVESKSCDQYTASVPLVSTLSSHDWHIDPVGKLVGKQESEQAGAKAENKEPAGAEEAGSDSRRPQGAGAWEEGGNAGGSMLLPWGSSSPLLQEVQSTPALRLARGQPRAGPLRAFQLSSPGPRLVSPTILVESPPTILVV